VDGTGAAADNGKMQIRCDNGLAKLKIRTEGSNLTSTMSPAVAA
jgi:hypothetical protein